MVSEERWQLGPFIAWIQDEYLPSVHVGPGPADFARRPGETVPALYGAADAACIMYSLDALPA